LKIATPAPARAGESTRGRYSMRGRFEDRNGISGQVATLRALPRHDGEHALPRQSVTHKDDPPFCTETRHAMPAVSNRVDVEL